MEAMEQEKYGQPDVFKLQDVEKASPKEEEVLVKVQANHVRR